MFVPIEDVLAESGKIVCTPYVEMPLPEIKRNSERKYNLKNSFDKRLMAAKLYEMTSHINDTIM